MPTQLVITAKEKELRLKDFNSVKHAQAQVKSKCLAIWLFPLPLRGHKNARNAEVLEKLWYCIGFVKSDKEKEVF